MSWVVVRIWGWGHTKGEAYRRYITLLYYIIYHVKILRSITLYYVALCYITLYITLKYNVILRCITLCRLSDWVKDHYG